jgi:hypothetical protein
MVLIDSLEEYLGNDSCSKRVTKTNEVCILREQVDHHQDGVEAFGLG